MEDGLDGYFIHVGILQVSAGATVTGRLDGRALLPQGLCALTESRGDRGSPVSSWLCVRPAWGGRGSGAHSAWERAGRSPGISQSSRHSRPRFIYKKENTEAYVHISVQRKKTE